LSRSAAIALSTSSAKFDNSNKSDHRPEDDARDPPAFASLAFDSFTEPSRISASVVNDNLERAAPVPGAVRAARAVVLSQNDIEFGRTRGW
jgi:hypothetical protein